MVMYTPNPVSDMKYNGGVLNLLVSDLQCMHGSFIHKEYQGTLLVIPEVECITEDSHATTSSRTPGFHYFVEEIVCPEHLDVWLIHAIKQYTLMVINIYMIIK